MELDHIISLAKAGKTSTALNFLKDFVINNEESINMNEKLCEEVVKMVKRFPSLNESWEIFVGGMKEEEIVKLVEIISFCLK